MPTPNELKNELIHIGQNMPVNQEGLISYNAAQELIKQKCVVIEEEKYILTELGKKAFEFNIKRIKT